MKHKILIAAAIISIFNLHLSSLKAQNLEHYYNRPFAHLGLNVGGGLGSMIYNNPLGKASPSYCLELGFQYSQFFSGIGIGVGIRYSTTHASAVYNTEEVTTDLTHANNHYAHYDLTTRFDDWHERQTIHQLAIPLEVLYRFSMGGGRHFIGGLGIQLDMPLKGTYSAGKGSYTTTGLFHVARPHTLSDMPEHGFSTYNETFDAEIDHFSVGLGLVADLGLHLPLGYAGGLYLGLFASYGLTSALDATDPTPLLVINASDASRIDYHGTFAANGNPSLHLLRVGVKVGIDIGAPMEVGK